MSATAMLRPQANAWRDIVVLDGLWSLRPDPDDVGRDRGWAAGFNGTLTVAVPGSWNEQLAEAGLMLHTGAVWLQRDVVIPRHAAGRHLRLWFGAADFAAEVWVNGVAVGRSGPLFLPFDMAIGDLVAPGDTARIVVRVVAELGAETITQAVTRDDYVAERRPRDEIHPAVRFDFFPFGGLSRPVLIEIASAQARIDSVRVEAAADGTVTVRATASGRAAIHARIGDVEATLVDGVATLRVVDPRPWCPDDPHLYALELTATIDGEVVDAYTVSIGLRDIAVEGGQLLLNGAPLRLRGFGKHEDSPVRGRGLDLPLMVKDFELLRWIGANSVRTSHYPYAEEFLDMADRTGILVISELPSINLDFRRTTEATLANHFAAAEAQVARDGIHPCVIAWSLANEPGYLAEPEYHDGRGADYWRALFGHVRALDPHRPLTGANVGWAGREDPLLVASDFLSINRYHGWYDAPGQIDRARAALTDELDALWERYGKPIIVSEFGADALAGAHATYPQLFTEEYQAELIATYIDVIEAHPAAIGAHIWNFADFRTAQHHRRVIFNLKGVFTRSREPKRAAFAVRELWTGS